MGRRGRVDLSILSPYSELISMVRVQVTSTPLGVLASLGGGFSCS
jgi:hypothetical protein